MTMVSGIATLDKLWKMDFGTENPYREFNMLINSLILPKDMMDNVIEKLGPEAGYYGMKLFVDSILSYSYFSFFPSLFFP